MNKNQHRIIFNARRGIRMAVAETATSQGKSASGESCGAAKSIAGVGTGFASLAFSLGAAVLLHASLLAPGAMAQVVADKSAPGNQQPTILQTASGVTQINIQTPSAGGVSRNTYSQFDVQKSGVILNNGRTDSNTQLSGFVQSNPWLAAGSARVILNEVNSSNPSQLNGFVEVAGQRAEVIIANPSGISVNGGGFLNASAVTLTTGTAVVNGGNLESYRVRGGVVTIEGAGLNTSTADYTNILARATQVNAGIWAKDLKIVTGVNQIDASNAANPAVTGSAGVASDATPAFALDVAQLGGMYAGKIFLLGTEAGLGVRNSGVVGATAGDVTVSNNGWLSNSGTLSAVGNTRISAQGDVTNTGDLVATDTTSISTTGTLTNKGLIDSGNAASTGQTQIDAAALSNIGTGRIYGDTISIAATTLTNDAEGTATATLAARQRLDIAVGTLNNLNGSNILSLGDMAIGGALDANRQATGSATTVTNSASTIEAQGALTLKSAQINNLNPLIEWSADAGTTGASGTVYFTPQGTFDSAQGASLATAEPLVGMAHGGYAYQHVEYVPSEVCSGGHEVTCTPTGPLVPVYSYAQGQVLPDGTSGATTFSGFATYTQTNYKAVITKSTPARIASGGDMTLVASQGIVNDQSAIVAGGALTITAPSVDNRARTITLNAVRNGTAYSWGRYDEGCGNVKGCNYDYQAYRPGAYQSTVGSTQVLDISVSKSASTDALSSQGTTLPVTSGTSLPSGSLYRIQSSPSATVLVQTDPRFTNYKTWLGSDYMTSRISLDPSVTQKRLGDGFYEQQLIREQVAKLTGNRFLANYTSDQQQYQTLMDAGLTYANTYQLRPGISLSAAQVAQLTSDIVWLQQETITLADGTTTQALVPHVYMAVRTGDLAPSGALLGGNTVAISTTGDLTNSGTILGRQLVQIDANTINNLMGQIQAKNVVLNAVQDINNVGGTVLGQDLLAADAGRDINVTSTTQSTSGSAGNYSFSQSGIDRVAGLYVTGPGILLASAGKDLNLSAAQIASAGSIQFQTGGDINLKTVQQSVTNNFGAGNADNHLLTGQSTELGTQINATGNVTLRAGKDLNAKAATVQAGGDLEVSAGNNVNISAGQKTTSYDRAEKKSTSDLFSSTTTTQRDTTTTQSAVASNFGGTNVTVTSQNDLKVKASTLIATEDLTLIAGKDIAIESAQNTSASTSVRRETKSGFSVDSTAPISLGESTSIEDASQRSTTQTASTVSGRNVKIASGRDALVKGSNLTASQDMALTAGRDVTIESAQNTSASANFRRETKSGFSVTDMGGLNYGNSQQSQDATQRSTTQEASTVSGANVKVQAGRDATIKASNLLADQDITVAAQRDINVLAAANTQTSTSHSDRSSTTHGLVGDVTGRQTFFGTTANMQDGSQTAVSQSTSVLSANKGNLTLVAANALPEEQPSTVGTVTTQGAELLAGKTVTIQGAAVDLQAIKDATSSLSHSESKTFTLGATPVGLLAMPGAIVDNIALSQNTQNSRLKDAAALKAGYDAYKMVSPTDAGATGGSGEAGSVSQGIGVSIHLDSSSSSTDSAANKSMSRGTNVQAKDIVIQATQGDITATAAKLQAENITLDAAKNVNLIAAANLETNTSSNSSNSAGVGVTFAVGGTQEGFSIQLRAAQAQGRSNGTETTYDNTQVTASKNLTVKSGTDTNLIGAQLAGETVKMEVGTSGTGKLNIETLQNTSTFKSEQSSSGFDMSLCIPPICYGSPAEFKLALAQQAIDHNYISAVGQSGIAAGKGGFDIAVAGNTDLKGAAITSSASADKNTLATQSLSSSDLTNQQSTSSSSFSITVGNSASMAKTALTNVLANLALQDGMPENGSQSSKTLSVISPATVTITGTDNAKTDAASDQQVALLTSRDASTANQTLTNTLTLQQAQGLQAKQQEAQENARAAQMMGEVTTSIVNDIAASQQRQLQVAENQRAQAANEKPAVIAAWGEGSTQKLALNALAGFVQASAAGKDGVAGAMNVLVMDVAAKGAKLIGDWATATDGKPAQIDAFMQAMSHAVLGCAVGAATAGNGSGCTPGAVGAVVGELAAKFYNPTGKGDKADTVAFAQTMAALAGALVASGTGDSIGQAGTIAASTGGNAAANNWLKHAEILDLIKAKNECQGGKGSANACVEVVRIEDRDKQRDKDLAAVCINPANPACAIAQQDVRSAYAETLRAYVRGDLKELTIKDRIVYIGNQAHTEVMANTTLSTKVYVGSGLYTTGASALQGLADLADGIVTFGKAALGNEDARDKVGATTAGLAKLLSQPENWGALLERATDAQALKLADAYEKGDTKALGAMVGELAGGIVDPVAVFKGAKLGVKAAEGLQEYVAARKAAEALNPVEYVVIDVPSKFGQAGAITVGGYRIETVPAEMRVAYKNADYIDPIDNKVKSAPVGETMAVDHIYPSNLIVKRDGFDKLTKEQMTDILQDRIGLGNLQPLPASLNQSKGGRLGWGSGYKGGAIDTTYLANLVAKQDAILVKIDTQIQAYIKMNRVGSK